MIFLVLIVAERSHLCEIKVGLGPQSKTESRERKDISRDHLPEDRKTEKSAASGLNDYHPVPLTPTLMKCSEELVLQHIKDNIPVSLDPHQYAFRTNRSTEGAVSTVLQSV